MKARFMIPVAFVALASCTGGSQQKSEEVANSGNVTSTVESACPAAAIDMAKVKSVWTEQVKKFNPEDEGTKFNKKALYDIDGDGINEVIFAECVQDNFMGFIGVFTNSKDGLSLVDFSNVAWQIGYIDIRPGGFVHTDGGNESGSYSWDRYSKIVNSKVDEVYFLESRYDEEEMEEGPDLLTGKAEYKCTLEKKGQGVKSISKEEYDKAVPQNADRIEWEGLKWEDVQF